jgi:hypothetical protein
MPPYRSSDTVLGQIGSREHEHNINLLSARFGAQADVSQ